MAKPASLRCIILLSAPVICKIHLINRIKVFIFFFKSKKQILQIRSYKMALIMALHNHSCLHCLCMHTSSLEWIASQPAVTLWSVLKTDKCVSDLKLLLARSQVIVDQHVQQGCSKSRCDYLHVCGAYFDKHPFSVKRKPNCFLFRSKKSDCVRQISKGLTHYCKDMILSSKKIYFGDFLKGFICILKHSK